MDGTDRLMTLAELSEILPIPCNTLYGWRCRGKARPATALAATCATADPRSRLGSNRRPISRGCRVELRAAVLKEQTVKIRSRALRPALPSV